MIDLDLLRTFLAIYRAGSLTQAARQLNLTQPAVTTRLKALEAVLRRPLFVREGRRIVATDAAHDLARSVSPHLDAIEAAVATARDAGDDGLGTVFIGGPAEFIADRFMRVLTEPVGDGLRFRFRLGLTGELIDDLSQGRLDFVIATGRIRAPGIDYAELYREDFVLVGAPQWAGRIDDAPKLAYAEDLPIFRRYWSEVFATEPDFQAALVVPDLRALASATAAGAGITVLPRYLCAPYLVDDRLVVLHDPPVAPGNDLFLAWNRFSQRHARNQRVRRHILAQNFNK